MTRRLNEVGCILVLAAVYFGAAKFGLSLAFVNASATAIWPPTGIALAALLLWGYRLWPGILLGAFLANITTQGTLLTSLGIATGNTLEALLGVWLVNQLANGRHAFEQARDIFKFILLAALVSTALSATFGATSLSLGGFARWNNYVPIWTTWWLGDALSALIVTPLIVIWSTAPFLQWNRRRLLEAAAIFAGLLLVSLMAFGGQVNNPSSQYVRLLLLPMALWAAYRFRHFGAINAVFVVSCLAIWGTLHGFGPFVFADPNESLMFLQSYLGVFTATNLILGALVSERAKTEQRLRLQEAVSRVLAESPTLMEATPKMLQVLCEVDGWDVGAIWTANQTANELSCVEFCHVPARAVPEFEAATRQCTFRPGIGLPGRTWSSGRAEWILDLTQDENFPRAPMAIKAGLRSGFCFPLKLGGETWGVIECFSREFRKPDEHFLQMFADIGSDLGQFIERKQAEQASRQSQERMRLILDAALDAAIMIDAQGCVREWNPQAEKMFGWTRSEALGKKLSDTIIPLQHREAHERGLRHYLATGIGPVLKKRIEITALHRDGREFPVELAIMPVTADRQVFFSAFIRDITERKAAELASNRLTAIVEFSNDAIIGKDLNGNVTSWNKAAEKIFGYTASEMVGTSLMRLIPADRQDEERQILAKIKLGENLEHFETRRQTKDGRLVDVSVTVSPIKDATGKVIGMSKAARDITERKRAEQELVAAKNEISRHAVALEETVTERTAKLRETIGELEAFSYSISHDMRAPLRAMRGFAEILLKTHSAQLDAEGIKYLENIHTAAGRMDALIQDVLTYTRVLRAEVKIEPVDLDALVHHVIRIYPQLHTGNVEIQIEGVLPKVLGSEASLAQCVSNLLTNAVKFVAPGTSPHVKVWAEEIEPKAEGRESRAREVGALDPRRSTLDSPTSWLWVEDNGIGIASENQARIFKMFERVNRATAYEGNGMGLTIVRKAVERMGGQMGVKSTPGQGSRFWIELRKAGQI